LQVITIVSTRKSLLRCPLPKAAEWLYVDSNRRHGEGPLHAFGFGQAAFALLPKDLALEPCDLTTQIHDLAFLFADQFDQVWWRQRSACSRSRSFCLQGDLLLYTTSMKVRDLMSEGFYSVETLDPEDTESKVISAS
jgi:hypothetical protein